ncbi:MAG TPA: acetate--CoA ligase family protein [Burkholderiales bacterium]|jgi:acyl-CoA synthetase (NDP forming)|nr:acetate--CoA ligase family protein [Burkholderiales bacterium]
MSNSNDTGRENPIARLISPRRVAVIGASADAAKTAGRPIAYLQKHGYGGEIYPVNPRSAEVAGLKSYPDAASLPEVPDVAIVLVGPERAEQALRELAARGCPAAIVLAAGYAEIGAEGAQRQRELKAAAGGMRILGPNAIGVVNLTERIVLSASGALEMEKIPAGKIAVVSQSGGILGSLLSRATGRGVGFSKLVSTGNEADLDVADFVDYLADDPATSVIALYVEGLRSPQKFREAAAKAARAGKPIVVYKVGRSESGERAAVSHTGALAGADRMYDALFAQIGVTRVLRFEELLDVAITFSQGRKLRGRRVAILTSTGGAGTLVADACGLEGFETPPPDEATSKKLAALQNSDFAASDRNPIDLTLAGLKPDLFRGMVGALLDSEGYDALIVIAGSSAIAQPELVTDAVTENLDRSDKPVMVYMSPFAPHTIAHINSRGVPAFSSPESCGAALAAIWRRGQVQMQLPARAAPAVPALLASFKPGALNESEAKQVFAAYGIPAVREAAVITPDQAATAARKLGGRLVLKVLSREIAHKSEVGGVRVGLAADEVRVAGEEMLRAVTAVSGVVPEGLLVQEMVGGGAELILGFHRDPQLGPAILLGMGGVSAELLKDTTVRLLPINQEDARAMLRELKTFPLLDGYRGRPRCDVEAAAAAILAFAAMAESLGERLLEAEINPLFVLPRGEGVRAADGLMLLN